MLAPDGGSPPRCTARRVVARRPQEFKMRCLRTIRDLFPPDWNAVLRGAETGTRTPRPTRTSAYRGGGRNFTINPKSEVVAETTRMTKRYTLFGDQRARGRDVPPVQRAGRPEEYADSNYWRRSFQRR